MHIAFNNFVFNTSLSLPKSVGTIPNLQISNLYTLLLNLLKLFGTFCNSSMPSLSISNLKPTKSASLANLDVSTPPVAFLSPILLHN